MYISDEMIFCTRQNSEDTKKISGGHWGWGGEKRKVE